MTEPSHELAVREAYADRDATPRTKRRMESGAALDLPQPGFVPGPVAFGSMASGVLGDPAAALGDPDGGAREAGAHAPLRRSTRPDRTSSPPEPPPIRRLTPEAREYLRAGSPSRVEGAPPRASAFPGPIGARALAALRATARAENGAQSANPPARGLPRVPGSIRRHAVAQGSAPLRRIPIRGLAWGQALEDEELLKQYLKLVSTGTKENEATGTMMQAYKSSTSELTLEELQQLRVILGQATVKMWVPEAELAKIDKEISNRGDPGWVKEQERLAEERKSKQKDREKRLLSQGLTKLGGVGDTWEERSEEIRVWFEALQESEAGETWTAVFESDRMSARQIGNKSTNMGGTFAVRNRNAPHDRSRDRTVALDRGASGITARTEPTNFYDPENGDRNKDVKGLHDLSASLLDHTKPSIIAQLKPYKDSIVVFMPVPSQDNMQIFNAVASLKDRDVPTFRTLKSKMTRIKLAQGSDMHTTLFDTSERPTDKARIRYGVTGLVQRGKGEDEVKADETDIAARKSNALEHNSILGPGAMQKVNEIVMAYRSHESKLFPMFARWEPDKRRFRVIEQNGEGFRDTENFVTDKGIWQGAG